MESLSLKDIQRIYGGKQQAKMAEFRIKASKLFKSNRYNINRKSILR